METLTDTNVGDQTWIRINSWMKRGDVDGNSPKKLVGSREAVLQIFGGYREEIWGMSHHDRRAMRMIATWRKEWSQPDA